MRILGGSGWLDRSARAAARAAIARLPEAVRRRIADYRFGYTGRGPRFAFEVLAGVDGLVATIDGRVRLHITEAFREDLRFHFVTNAQSRREMRAFIAAAARLPPDALLFDVGAHRGLFALVHCALGPDRRAVLLEPSTTLARDACQLLTMNGFAARAEVRTAGAAERTGRRRVVEDELHFARAAAGDGGIETEFVSLDDEWTRVGTPPALVKIDVEGAEAEVLRGASRLLAEARPTVFLELHMDVLRSRGERIEPLLAGLRRQGYRLYDLDGRSRSASSIARSMRAIVRLVLRAEEARQ